MKKQLRKAFSRALPINSFSKGVSVLIGGTLGGQLILLLAMPVMTRLYEPSAFGVLGVFVSVVAILNILALLRYNFAIPIPASNKEGLALAALSALVLIFFIAILTVLLLLFGNNLMTALHLEVVAPYTWFIPAAVALSNLYSIVSFWAVREKSYLSLAKSRLAQSGSSVTAQLILYQLGPVGLIIGFIISSSMGAYALGKVFVRSALESGARIRQLPRLVFVVAAKYKQFPLFSTWNGLLNAGGREAPPILIAAMLGPVSAGIYFLAARVLMAPISVVTDSIAKVFQAEAPRAMRDEKLGALVGETSVYLLRIFGVPIAIFALIAPSLFSLVFGAEWEEAGTVAQLLCPWLLVRAVVNPISPLPGILNKQGIASYFEVLLIVSRIGGLLVGLYMESLVLAVGLFSVGAMIALLVTWCWFLVISKVRLKSIFRRINVEVIKIALVLLTGLLILDFCGDLFLWAYCGTLALIAGVYSILTLVKGLPRSFENTALS